MSNIRVRVNDELTLDAGRWEEVERDGEVWRRVYPPAKTMFEQVLEYLEAVSGEQPYAGLNLGEEAIAATAVCVRWGSYLAVLADRDRPLWPQARREGLSRISDGEMARINVEASAALERWIDIMRDDWDRYYDLMRTAARVLPMTRKRAPTGRSLSFAAFAAPEMVPGLMAMRPDQGVQARAEAEAHPSRVLANAIIKTCWRNNGPVEDIHAGYSEGPLPLTQRRITLAEERALVRVTSGHLAQATLMLFSLVREQDGRSWPERVLPFNLVPFITPHGWSLDEKTRQVWLFGAEPEVEV